MLENNREEPKQNFVNKYETELKERELSKYGINMKTETQKV
jgi:hypothetical protein